MLSKKLLHCDLMQRARVSGSYTCRVALPLAPVEERSPADEQTPSAGMPRCQGGLLLLKRSKLFARSSSTGDDLSADDVAAILGCNPRTLLRWHRENEDPRITKKDCRQSLLRFR
jgi:hypothetical protein